MIEVSEELRLTKSELEEKRTLNEKLELDLLQLEMHKPNSSGSAGMESPGNGGISDLDLMGKKSPPVGIFPYNTRLFVRSHFSFHHIM